ncbi:primosomal protein [Nakamurella deserti]|uniref:primosomal protein n=1 Tax=Nakamurella deserti TaxID=2164074 RepID=UPI000DBE93E6|nr:primosomal protein [Nakamurella deserti]
MAADIVPIELGLTAGNLVTLWAPRWREDGEEWEAFLGHGEFLYAFPDTAHLAAFIRTETEHDLADHPDWADVPDALVDELEPSDERRIDLVGVPELVAGPADIWTVAELADTVAILRSLAEVCDLEVVLEVLGSTEGFEVLPLGDSAFTGRTGEKLWDGIGAAVVARWDEVVDAVDAIVTTPDVDPEALARAQAELASVSKLTLSDAEGSVAVSDAAPEAAPELERAAELEFWDELGIDCISVAVDGVTGYTLRCYLGEDPVFLAENGRIQMFTDTELLATYLADASVNHTMANLEVFGEVRDEAATGDLEIAVGPENTYELDGLMQQLIKGPGAVDRRQLELAVELLVDAAAVRGDDETAEALGSSSPLGFLINATLRPDPNRIQPTPPFTDEVTAWNVLVESFVAGLDWHPERSAPADV